jgi:hypothetical protein
MKAMVRYGYGAPQDVLRLADVAIPIVGGQDVLVSVRASSANPWDWHFIRGEPVLLRPAGLGGVPKPKVPVPGRGPRRNGGAGRRRESLVRPPSATSSRPWPSTRSSARP